MEKDHQTIGENQSNGSIINIEIETKQELFNNFVDTVIYKIIKYFENRSLDKKQKEYAKLIPKGLNDAPKFTQDYREQLKNRAVKGDELAINEMEFFKGKFYYNPDGSVNLLKIESGKTFCADLTKAGLGKDVNDGKKLAQSRGYRLLTDWDDIEQVDKENTDRYKLEEYFGDYINTGSVLHMLGCIAGVYCTDISNGKINVRLLSTITCRKGVGNVAYDNYKICGIKDNI